MTEREDWKTLADSIKALPEGKRLFLSLDYEAKTDDTGLPCGCLMGTLYPVVVGEPVPDNDRTCVTERVAEGLEIGYWVAKRAERLNDYFKKHENDEATCRARYAHTLARCEAWAEGGPELPGDTP